MQRRVFKIAELATRPARPAMLPLSESTIRRLAIELLLPEMLAVSGQIKASRGVGRF